MTYESLIKYGYNHKQIQFILLYYYHQEYLNKIFKKYENNERRNNCNSLPNSKEN